MNMIKAKSFSIGSVLVVVSVLLVGCDSPVADETAQRLVMHDLATGVMLPILEEVDTEAANLSKAVSAFCETPSPSTLSAAEDAFRVLRAPWKRTEAFRFGPSEDLRLASALDFWPARTDSIEAAFSAAPDPVTPAYVETLGTSARGMPTLEYLLFDPTGGPNAVLVSLGGAEATSVKRCGYARALAEVIAKDAAKLHNAWAEEGDAFVLEVANAGNGSALFPTGQEGIGRVVNLLVSSMIAINENKLTAPLGTTTGTPDPSLVESRFSDNSAEDLLNALRGVEELYIGRHGEKTGKGISSLVVARSPAIDAAVKKGLVDAQAKASALEAAGPLRLSITNNPAAVTATHESIKTARRYFSTDVASVLGVSVTLSDTDGD